MIIKQNDFVLQHTFDCGQCFRWEQAKDGSYIGIAGGKVLKAQQQGAETILSCSRADFDIFWKKYLDLDRDYSEIKRSVSINPLMEEAVSYGGGIRILHQEFFETLISFIISQRSSIPKIKSCVKKLCELYGDAVEFDGQIFHAFPDAERLSSLSENDLRALGVGYRAPYIMDACQRVCEGTLDVKMLETSETPIAREKLMQIKGVGDKVCDCVLLFSLGKFDLFPSDVWIKRVMAEQFASVDAKSTGENIFGQYSGFAQQYLFYWRKFNENAGN